MKLKLLSPQEEEYAILNYCEGLGAGASIVLLGFLTFNKMGLTTIDTGSMLAAACCGALLMGVFWGLKMLSLKKRRSQAFEAVTGGETA